MKSLTQLVSELSNLHGVSSREDDVIAYMREEFLKVCSDVNVDVLGNVICRFKSGHEDAKRLLVFAHTDELGFIVRKVERDGFLRIQRVGGVHVNVLPGLHVDVIGDFGIVKGVIGIKSHHVTKPEEKGVLPGVDSLYVDIGAENDEEARLLGVHTGSFITYESREGIKLGKSKLRGKAMDDRAGCAVLVKFAEEIAKLESAKELNWDVYVVACVQEEFNVRGIMPAVNEIRPDASIGLDICISSDTPEMNGYSEIKLGAGPAITYMNFHGRGTLAGVLPDKKLQSALEETCRQNSIPFQREVIVGLLTENAYILFSNGGVPVANLSIPCRYSHTPIETVDERDLEKTVKLLTLFTKSLKREQSFGKNS